jgi:hypothetical protein
MRERTGKERLEAITPGCGDSVSNIAGDMQCARPPSAQNTVNVAHGRIQEQKAC